MSASDPNKPPTEARNVSQNNVERAVGGSFLGGMLGGVLGALIGGFLGGMPMFFPREPDIQHLTDMFTGFVLLFVGAAVGGVLGAVCGAMVGAGSAVAKSDRPHHAPGMHVAGGEGEKDGAD